MPGETPAMMDTPPLSNRDASLLDTFLVRIGGVDHRCLVGLRAQATSAALASIRSDARERQERARVLADRLHGYVPSALCAHSRHAIVRLRRDLYNGRLPAPMLLATAEGSLPPDVTDAIRHWCSTAELACHAVDAAESQYNDELRRARSALKAALRDQRFMAGLALASPELFAALAEYTDGPAEPSSARARRQEHSFVQYLTRATTKASPFSTFTVVGAGSWYEDAGPLLCLELGQVEASHCVRPNALHIQRLWSSYLARPEVRHRTKVRLHPGVRIAGDALRYVALNDDPHLLKRHFGALERSVRIPLTPPIRRILQFLESSHEGAALLTDLATHLALPTAQLAESTASPFLDKLVNIGLLQPCLQLPDQATADLESVVRVSYEEGGEFSIAFAGHIDNLHQHVVAYAAEDGPGRARCAAKIRSALDAAANHVGLSLPTNGSVVYEDVTVNANIATASRSAWLSTAEDLRCLQSLQPIWDPQMRYRLAAADLFKTTYGALGRTSVVEFLRTLKPYTEAWLQVGQTEGSHLSIANDLPDIATLNALFDELRAHISWLASSQEMSVQLSSALLRGLTDRLPEAVRERRASNAFFCQPAQIGDRPLVVLNHMYPGLGKFFSRFLGMLDPSVLSTVRAGLSKSLSPETDALELPGVFGSNVNLHPPLAPLELRYPGIISGRPANELVDVADLELSYDNTTALLRLLHAPTGRDLHPFFPGLMVPLLLPPTLQSLNLLFGDGLAEVSPHAWCEHQLTHAEQSQIRKYPRMLVGSVVVARQAWYMPANAAPCLDARATDFEVFRCVADWRESVGLPQHVFVRTLGTARDPKEGVEGYWRRLLGAKPQYIDWTNPLLVRLFAKLVRSDPNARLVVNEMLPDFSQAPKDALGHPVVTELVLQLDTPPYRPC